MAHFHRWAIALSVRRSQGREGEPSPTRRGDIGRMAIYLRCAELKRTIQANEASTAMADSSMSKPVLDDKNMLALDEKLPTEYVISSAHEASSRKSLPQ